MVGPNLIEEFYLVKGRVTLKLEKLIKDVNNKAKFGGDPDYRKYKTLLIFYNYLTYIERSPYTYRKIKALYNISNFANQI